MSGIDDARFIRSEERMQHALLTLLQHKPLADIGVTELAQEAQVSRATFYAHYENVNDVYEQIVQHFMSDIQGFNEHFDCTGGAKSCPSQPYCERIREADEYGGVARDAHFFATMMSFIEEGESFSLKERLIEAGISRDIARALTLFQMSGCHTLATSARVNNADWPQIRQAVDRFIEGGVAALTSGKSLTKREGP